jgi:CRISPR system Cascade subunit CasC
MFLELHMIQNFAPSNLNRDDTNSPKDCEFGGYRRARISSQCLKRAIREEFRDRDLLPAENRATRTRRLVNHLTARFEADGRDPDASQQVAIAAIQGIGLDFGRESDPDDPKNNTEYLLYLGESEIDRFAEICDQNWDELLEVGKDVAPVEEAESGRRAAKRRRKASLSKDVSNALLGALDGGKAADLAMFGRMIADLPGKRIDAASQVAHAISTNRVSVEFDFYTAVDDFVDPHDETGAGMMGTIEFNSACFYRYANIDLAQLQRNLEDDAELTRATVDAFLRASISAVPTGKQNSMAAQNPPSFVLAVVRDAGLWSLANAFLKPARPDGSSDLVDISIRQLDDYWGKLNAMYGDDGLLGAWYVSLGEHTPVSLDGADAGNLNTMIGNVLQQIADSAAPEGAAG